MQIILHNYPQSPVAEKIRVVLGIKGLEWRSVEIPRLPPKPLLTPLTGGYRRTPVMQVGADVYCDSQCIIRELERRFPEPSLLAGEARTYGWGFSRWSDGALFEQAVKVVLGAAGDALPRDFAEDRGRLYLGPDWAAGLKAATAGLAHLAAQLRAGLGWIEDGLADGRPFLAGDRPGLPDALIYHVVWFLRGRWVGGPPLLSEFAALQAWEARVRDIGHGTPAPLPAEEALSIAADTEPLTPEVADEQDPQGLRPGMAVSVEPDVDGGEVPVTGMVRYADRDSVALTRSEDAVGTVCVHFPRAGYRVTLH